MKITNIFPLSSLPSLKVVSPSPFFNIGNMQITCVYLTSRRPRWRSKQRNGGHIGGVKFSFGDQTLFLCKTFLLFHNTNMASGHVREQTLKINSSRSVLQLCWGRRGGVTPDEKRCFHSNTKFYCSKALVLVGFFTITFFCDCSTSVGGNKDFISARQVIQVRHFSPVLSHPTHR